MKIEMAWPCAGFSREKTVRNEFPVFQVDAVDHHFVNAEVGREYVAPRGVGYCAMSMRTVLSLRVSAFASMLRHVGRFAKGAVGANRIDHDVAAAVICRHYESARRMN